MGGVAAAGDAAKLRSTYGQYDVDDAYITGDGTLTEEPEEALLYGGRLVTSEFEEGDLVVFCMHAIHGSATNTTAAEDGLGRLRLSIDVRFQPASDPVDERWMGPPPWGYKIATYQRRGNMPGAVSMAEQKERWGLPGLPSGYM